MTVALMVFQGRAGDHNDLGIPGAKSIGSMLAHRLNLQAITVGTPEPALSTHWRKELEVAMPALRELKARFEQVYEGGSTSIAATSRCAVSLATLPAVAKYRPGTCVVWFDSHADLNTPQVSKSGYLGGLALSGPLGLWDSGLGAGFKASDVILVGQRDLDPFEVGLISKERIVHLRPGVDYYKALASAIAGRPVYVHLDCDVLNPGIVPTDYVHERGLSLADLKAASDAIALSEVVGIEIAEFQDAWHIGGEPVSPAPLLDALHPIFARMTG